MVIKYCRFLQSVNIYIRNSNPLSFKCYYLKYLTIISSSLLYISQFNLVEASFQEKKATKYNSPFLLYYNNTPPSVQLDEFVLIIYLRSELKWARIKVIIKRYFKLLKAYLYLSIYSNFIFFFVKFINSQAISKK